MFSLIFSLEEITLGCGLGHILMVSAKLMGIPLRQAPLSCTLPLLRCYGIHWSARWAGCRLSLPRRPLFFPWTLLETRCTYNRVSLSSPASCQYMVFFFPCCLCRRRRLQKEEINYTQEKTTIRHDADPHTWIKLWLVSQLTLFIIVFPNKFLNSLL